MAIRKTTLMLSEDVIADYKSVAAKLGRSLSSVVEDALRRAQHDTSKPRPERWELPSFGPKGTLPSIDWDSNAAVLEFIESDVPLEKRR